MKQFAMTVLAWAFISQPALADICDYRPSQVLGAGGSSAVAGSTAAAAATGAGMKAAGLYTLTHATSGAVMLGSTAAGSSAAGTVGIIAGSAGFFGVVGTALMSPFVIVPAAVAAVGVSVYEGGCYMFSE